MGCLRGYSHGIQIDCICWYGGKYSHLDWLLPLLPEATHYCEPFGGSAAVLLNRNPAPVETYNDVDGEVVNFFRVLRDDKDRLLEAIGLTPFSREEFELAISEPVTRLSELERARRFFRASSSSPDRTCSNGECRPLGKLFIDQRAGMAGAVSRWLGSVEGLSEIAQRLLRVQIEHADAVDVIQKYDSPETLFYCDPPYPHDSRGDKHAYAYEMSDRDHRRLAEVLHCVNGKVAISSYKIAALCRKFVQ